MLRTLPGARAATTIPFPRRRPNTRFVRYASSKPNTEPPPPQLLTLLRRLYSVGKRLLDSINPVTLLKGVVAVYLCSHICFSYVLEYNGCFGVSMIPTVRSYGDYILISKYYRRGRGIQVGDIVSYAHPVFSEQRAIKRVLGMEGDFVLRDTPGAEGGLMLQIPHGHCWVVGDNLTHSRDSRMFGPLPLALIKGKVIRRFEPWFWPHKVDDAMLEPAADNDVD